MIPAVGYAAKHSRSGLKPHHFERDEPASNEVQIDILYCGVCRSDVHQVRNDWKNTVYPCLPGHEIVGRVVRAGDAVTRFKVGDTVGVGCMIDSCQQCEPCGEGLEQYCEGPKSWTATYNGPMKPDGTNTFGGYSDTIVVREEFVLRIPEGLDLQAVPPLLCAGITTYSPLRHWNVQPGEKVGVVGLGGLGHMAVKLATAMGAEVTVFTTKPDEKGDDARRLGAVNVVESSDKKAMADAAESQNYVLDTIPEVHDFNPFLQLLKRDGTMTVVGVLAPSKEKLEMMEVLSKRRSLAGSIIGGIAETQEVLDFCGEHGITAEVQVIPIQEINDAFDQVVKGDIHFRFVIDMASLKAEEAVA